MADRLAVPAELVLVSTVGDRLRETPLEALPIRGVFVKEVQQAVLDGRADAAVHSAKDLPARTAAGLAIAAVPVRADPRDVLVGGRLDELLPGATIATGAPRRRAQLAWRRPDLTFTGLRGSIETRLGKIPEGGAVVTALAALERLGLIGVATEVLEPEVLLPQAGQGALAIECREGDDETAALLATIDDASSHAALDAERAVLAELGGGCDAPVGALAVSCEGGLRLEAVVASPEG
ncbi:MAG: hydroxymethylbilane synthase, partial [Acidimicrobiales bacterium]